MPFQRGARDDNPCIPLLRENIDYVYIPSSRRSLEFETVAVTNLVITLISQPCRELARKLICSFYYPSCGNSTHFKPPKSVCSEICTYIRDSICPFEWQQAFSEQLLLFLEDRGLPFLECSDPGKPIRPLEHCCYDAGIVLEGESVSEWVGGRDGGCTAMHSTKFTRLSLCSTGSSTFSDG